MSTTVAALEAWRSSEWYAARARRTSILVVALSAALAVGYAIAIVVTRGDPVLLAPLAVGLVVAAIVRRPVVGVFLLFSAALLFEQFEIAGVSPITQQTHIFENLSSYSPIPLRLSVIDLLLTLTLASWVVRRIARRETIRTGPFATAVALYVGAFAIGAVIGVARGGEWDPSAALAEIRGPLYLGVLYFLTADLIRDRAELIALAWGFVVLIGVKGIQGIVNYANSSGSLEAVTSHEDVVFFNVAVGLAIVAVLLGLRTRLSLALVMLAPLILAAELFTQRRAGFVGLGVVLLAITVLFLVTAPRRGVALLLLGGMAVGAYVPLAWDQNGPMAAPIRAVRAALNDPSVTVRDQLSDQWRDIENANIQYTMRQVPLTGVGVGQEYFFQQQPPRLPASFTYWSYMTHNAVLWVWLKAGPLGAFALWFMVARVVLFGSSLWARLSDPHLRLVAVLPVALVLSQIVFSSVELGLTYSRTMIMLGTALGMAAFLAARLREDAASAPTVAAR
jgi:O-antigen ligase